VALKAIRMASACQSGAAMRNYDFSATHSANVAMDCFAHTLEGLMVEAIANNGDFFWNVNAAVGPGQPNLIDDVELVRFGYFMMRQSPEANGELKALKPLLDMLDTKGDFDQSLKNIITVHESLRGGTQDGKVSRAHVTMANRGLYDRKTSWIILGLNTFMIDFYLYPRLDLHTRCGPNLKTVVKRTLGQK